MSRYGKTLVLALAALVLIFAGTAAGYFYFKTQSPKGESVNVGNYTKTIPDAKPGDTGL